jgi:N-acetylmuramoyl-L-alanine amidase
MTKRRAAAILAAGLLLTAVAGPAQDVPAGGTAEVYNLRHFTHPNFTRIVVDVGVLREYVAAETKSPAGITVDILQSRLNPIVPEEAVPARCDYIDHVRIAQKTATTVRLTVEADPSRVRRWQVYHLFDPFRIVLDIYPGEAPAAPSAKDKIPAAPQPAQPSRQGYTMARQLGLGVRTVVIDPGHGGLDPGCLVPDGAREKDLALDVALRLKNVIQANTALQVILTRETDIYVPLENRTVIANQAKADLFVSIHINAFKTKDRRGIETFFLNFSPDPAVNELAARENATTTKTIGAMDTIIRRIAQNSRVIESRELAEKVQAGLVRLLSGKYRDVKDLGTKGGPFWTLLGSEMPSILVEVAHLTNPEEAKRLSDPTFRQNVARGIYEGLMAYVRSLGKG